MLLPFLALSLRLRGLREVLKIEMFRESSETPDDLGIIIKMLTSSKDVGEKLILISKSYSHSVRKDGLCMTVRHVYV